VFHIHLRGWRLFCTIFLGYLCFDIWSQVWNFPLMTACWFSKSFWFWSILDLGIRNTEPVWFHFAKKMCIYIYIYIYIYVNYAQSWAGLLGESRVHCILPHTLTKLYGPAPSTCRDLSHGSLIWDWTWPPPLPAYKPSGLLRVGTLTLTLPWAGAPSIL
jgi:hypothetical protein